jgi:Spy/CpxP family protein refolding chaperone
MLSTKNLVITNLKVLIKGMALTLSLCAFSLTPLAVLSQSADPNDPVAIYKQAGINAEQESSIRKLAQDYDKENSVRLQSLAQMLQELRDMAYQKTLNESGMISKQEEINKLQSEMALQRIKLVIKIRGLLTPAQNEKLVAALQSRVRSEEQNKLR